jgi:hypothetical protein
VEEVRTLVTREPTGCAKRMRRSGLLYTLRSCHMWMDPSLAPPIMRRPVRRERERAARERDRTGRERTEREGEDREGEDEL